MSDALRIRASSACPACGRRHVVDIHEALEAKPTGEYPIAGAWPKVVATSTWRYTCTNCGATGRAATPHLSRGLPVAACGHTMATGHYAGGDHDAQSCPGCCSSCQRIQDALRESRT